MLVAAAALAFVVLALHAAWVETPTVDEYAHVPAGVAYLRYGAFDLYAKNPPLFKMLMAAPVVLAGAAAPQPPQNLTGGWAPWEYGSRFLAVNRDRYIRLFFLARLVAIAAGLLTGLILYRWARELFAAPAAAVATALYFLDPTVLAHSHLATVDAAAMLSITLSVYALRRALAAPSLPRFALAGLAWGAALSVKFTALLLLPVILGLVALRRPPRRLAASLVVIGITALFAVNLSAGFSGAGRQLGSFAFASAFGRSLQRAAPAWLPVPLPASYAAGFDAQKYDAEHGEFPTYFAGSWRTTGPWYYDLVALGAKTPLWALALFVLGAGAVGIGGLPRLEKFAILAPPLLLLLAFAAFNSLKIGIRYLLPTLPFLYLAGAALWRKPPNRTVRLVMLTLLALQFGAAIRVHPEYLSYFNAVGGGEEGGHHLLLDSNLDWGQDLYRLPAALARLGYTGTIGLLYFGHVDPALYGIHYEIVPPFPVAGVLAVSVNYLMGAEYVAVGPGGNLVGVGKDYLAWLRSRQPVARCGSIWIFDTRAAR